MMDWVVNVELQFSAELDMPPELFSEEKRMLTTADQVRAHIKQLLEVCIQEKYLTHYHLLGEPRQAL